MKHKPDCSESDSNSVLAALEAPMTITYIESTFNSADRFRNLITFRGFLFIIDRELPFPWCFVCCQKNESWRNSHLSCARVNFLTYYYITLRYHRIGFISAFPLFILNCKVLLFLESVLFWMASAPGDGRILFSQTADPEWRPLPHCPPPCMDRWWPTLKTAIGNVKSKDL